MAQTGAGGSTLHPRAEADDWNAQLSLLAGMCAAQLMLAQASAVADDAVAGTDAVQRMRHIAAALRLRWPAAQGVGPWLAALDANAPTTMAMMTEATRLLRGADYVAFDGSLPELTTHGALAARMRTSPRLCGGSATGSPPRCAWRIGGAGGTRLGAGRAGRRAGDHAWLDRCRGRSSGRAST